MLFIATFLSLLWPLAVCLPSVLPNGMEHIMMSPRPTSQWTAPKELAQFNFKPFLLSNLCLDCTRESRKDMYKCEFQFHWVDPNFNTSSHCKNSWDWDGVTMEPGPNNGINMEYLVCSKVLPEVWQFSFTEMLTPANFGLNLAHRCKDNIHFPSTEIAQFFSMKNLTLSPRVKSEMEIRYAAAGPVHANISGMTI